MPDVAHRVWTIPDLVHAIVDCLEIPWLLDGIDVDSDGLPKTYADFVPVWRPTQERGQAAQTLISIITVNRFVGAIALPLRWRVVSMNALARLQRTIALYEKNPAAQARRAQVYCNHIRVLLDYNKRPRRSARTQGSLPLGVTLPSLRAFYGGGEHDRSSAAALWLDQVVSGPLAVAALLLLDYSNPHVAHLAAGVSAYGDWTTFLAHCSALTTCSLHFSAHPRPFVPRLLEFLQCRQTLQVLRIELATFCALLNTDEGQDVLSALPLRRLSLSGDPITNRWRDLAEAMPPLQVEFPALNCFELQERHSFCFSGRDVEFLWDADWAYSWLLRDALGAIGPRKVRHVTLALLSKDCLDYVESFVSEHAHTLESFTLADNSMGAGPDPARIVTPLLSCSRLRKVSIQTLAHFPDEDDFSRRSHCGLDLPRWSCLTNLEVLVLKWFRDWTYCPSLEGFGFGKPDDRANLPTLRDLLWIQESLTLREVTLSRVNPDPDVLTVGVSPGVVTSRRQSIVLHQSHPVAVISDSMAAARVIVSTFPAIRFTVPPRQDSTDEVNASNASDLGCGWEAVVAMQSVLDAT